MTTRVEVGTPSTTLSGWTTIEVAFNGFTGLPSVRGESVDSPEFLCCANTWTLDLYPGGDEDSDDGYVAVELVNRGDEAISAWYSFSVRDASGKEMCCNVSHGKKEFGRGECWANDKFAKRSEILDLLVNGALIIEVRIRLTESSVCSFVPKNPLNNNILKRFMDEETADLVFEVVVDGQKKRGRKKAKATNTFYAHRFILRDSAPVLADLCQSSGGDLQSIKISDVKPGIFRHMLYYAYGGVLSGSEMKESAKDLIDASNKYGMVHLKLEAETHYVNSTTITLENMIDNLLYADSMNCALLKEAVIDFSLDNARAVSKKVSSLKDAPAGLLGDILVAVDRKYNKESVVVDSDDEEEDGKYCTMRVGELRRELDGRGLDVDGSREVMIAALKENDSKEQADE